MKVTLRWTNRHGEAEGHRIYRYVKPIELDDLPQVYATIDSDLEEWVDSEVRPRQTYYYRIETFKGIDSEFTTNIRVDTAGYTGPGPDKLVAGDISQGFYGILRATEFMTGPELRQRSGHTLPAANDGSLNQRWAKVALNGKTLFVPLGNLFGDASWRSLYRQGLVYGVDSDGPSRAVEVAGRGVNQLRLVEKNGHRYKIRLLKGLPEGGNPDSLKSGNWGGATPGLNGSEFNDVMVRLGFNVYCSGNTGLTPNAVATNSVISSATLCQEIAAGSNEVVSRSLNWARFQRINSRNYQTTYPTTDGVAKVGHSATSTRYNISGSYGYDISHRWCPVLELIEPEFDPEFENDTNGVGNVEVVIGTEQLGYMDIVSSSDFVTGTDLAKAVDLAAGEPIEENNDTNWIKYIYKGKVRYIPQKPIRRNLTRSELFDHALLDGRKVIRIKDSLYRVTLMNGIGNGNQEYAGAGNDLAVTHGSEWNQVMYRLYQGDDVTDSERPYIPWLTLGNEDLDLTYYCFTLGDIYGHPKDMSVSRGFNSISNITTILDKSRTEEYGWRPVLELVDGHYEIPEPSDEPVDYWVADGSADETEIVKGDAELGYITAVPATGLITGDELASRIGFTAGDPIEENNDTNWIKYSYDGKVKYVAQRTLRNNLAPNDVPGLGSSSEQHTPRVIIAGELYEVSLLHGIGNKYANFTGHGDDIEVTHGSEWNQVMYRLYSGYDTTDSEKPYENWLELDNDQLSLKTHDFVLGDIYGRPTDMSIARGFRSVGYMNSLLDIAPSVNNGWRPTLTSLGKLNLRLDDEGTSLMGTYNAVVEVEVRDGEGTVVGSTTLAEGGEFTVALERAITDGESVSVVFIDNDIESDPITVIGNKDTIAPATPTAAFNDDGTVITGVAEANSTIMVASEEDTLAIVEANAEGDFSVTLDTPVTDGDSVTITATDAAGNVSEPLTLVSSVDTIAPDAPVASFNEDGTILNGTAEVGATISVTDTEGVLGTTTVNEDGTFEITLDAPITDGDSVFITATDTAGNVSEAVEVVGELDTLAPAAPEATLNKEGTAVSGTAEEGSTVVVADSEGLQLGSVVVAEGVFEIELSREVVEGEVLSVTATDSAGNRSAVTEIVVPITPVAPTITNAVIDELGTTVTGTATPDVTVRVTDAEDLPLGESLTDEEGSFSITLSRAITDGERVAVLAIGEDDLMSESFDLIGTLDTIAPDTPVATINEEGTDISGEAESNATITVTDINDIVIGEGQASDEGLYTVVLDRAVTDNETVLVTAVDAAGNVSGAVEVTGKLDTVAPSAPIAEINEDGTVINGITEEGATVNVTDSEDVSVGSVTTQDTDEYIIVLDRAIVNGEVVHVTATDMAGNQSSATEVVGPTLVEEPVVPEITAASIDEGGLSVTGTATPEATVQATDGEELALGNGQVSSEGDFTFTLERAITDGEEITLTATLVELDSEPFKVVGNEDTVAPDAPVAQLDELGTMVTGTAEADATINVADVEGENLGSVIAADGEFSIELNRTAIDGETLSVTATDDAGNVSDVTELHVELSSPDDPILP